jgi:hypothetical protein
VLPCVQSLTSTGSSQLSPRIRPVLILAAFFSTSPTRPTLPYHPYLPLTLVNKMALRQLGQSSPHLRESMAIAHSSARAPVLARSAVRPSTSILSSLRAPAYTPAASFSTTPRRFNTPPGGIPPQSELPKGAEVIVPKVRVQADMSAFTPLRRADFFPAVRPHAMEAIPAELWPSDPCRPPHCHRSVHLR